VKNRTSKYVIDEAEMEKKEEKEEVDEKELIMD
jgi:hypothetical protein